MVRLDDVRPGVWDATVEVMEQALHELEFDGDDIVYNWRKDANLKRRERELFEKYGFLKDIILNPTFQEWKQWFDEIWDRNAPSTDMTLGDPIMPLTTCIVVLFLMHRRVPNDILVLAGGILFNVNPIYVVLGTALFHFSLRHFREKPKQYVKITPKARDNDDLALPYSESQLCDDGESSKDGVANNLFDHVLIGSDISTLFAASLLSKVGHRCCVLQPEGDSPTSIESKDTSCTIPLTNLTVSKPERYQALLDVVQKGLEDKERVHLVPVGRQEESYTHTLLKPSYGLGTRTQSPSNGSQRTKRALGAPISISDIWCLRPSSISTFVNELSSWFFLATSGSSLMELLERLYELANDGTTSFLLNRTFPSSVQQPPAGQSSELSKTQVDTNFDSICCASVADILTGAGIAVDSPEFDTIFGASLIGANEIHLSPYESSGNILAQAIATMESGMFYPKGGSVALEKMLISVVHRSGGLVVNQVPVKEIVLEHRKNTDSPSTPPQGHERVQGANTPSLSDYVADRVALEGGRDIYANKSIISGMGVISTYSNFMFSEESDKVDPQDLAALRKRVFDTTLNDLQEQKPVIKAVFSISGASEGGTDADAEEFDSVDDRNKKTNRAGDDVVMDYKTTPGAMDYVEYHVEGISELQQRKQQGNRENGCSRNPSLWVWSPSARDPTWALKHPGVQVVIMEYECTEPYITQRKLTGSGIPLEGSVDDIRGPSVYVRRSEEIHMTDIHKTEFLRVAERKLRQLYPALVSDNRIIHSEVVLPSRYEGGRCANTISKYSKPLSACSDLKGLYFCGRDVATSGGLSADLQGGFVAANAVLDYTLGDKANGRNVLRDLQNII